MSQSTKNPKRKKEKLPQKNNLDRYFSASKTCLDTKHQVNENERNLPNVTLGFKRKNKSENNNCVKFQKVEENSNINSKAKIANVTDTRLCLVSLRRIDDSNRLPITKNGQCNVALLPANCKLANLDEESTKSVDKSPKKRGRPKKISMVKMVTQLNVSEKSTSLIRSSINGSVIAESINTPNRTSNVKRDPLSKETDQVNSDKSASMVKLKSFPLTTDKPPAMSGTPRKVGRPKNVDDLIQLNGNEPSFSLLHSSLNDSVIIDSINTPKQTSDIKEGPSSKETDNDQSDSKNRISSSSMVNVESNSLSTDKQPENCQRKQVSASSFLDIAYSQFHNDFCKTYKLGFVRLPECLDLEKCKALHKDTQPKEINSYQYGHVFNIFDCPFPDWHYDILPAVSMILNGEQHLRGDMIRMLFDYILNGPNEDLLWQVKTILVTHWFMHPACTDYMHEFYLELLDRKYRRESFFQTKLTDSGVLTYIMDQMENILKPQINEMKINEENNPSEADSTDNNEQNLNYEVLEERFINHQPLIDEEEQEVIETIEDLFTNLSQGQQDIEDANNPKYLRRLTIALEIILDLLEMDFAICVSRLKSSLKNECDIREPLVKQLLDDCFQSRVLKFYLRTTDSNTWTQLSRLIGMMAETVHLFSSSRRTSWKYPEINEDCEEFARIVFENFTKGGWDENECLSRLHSLQPTWLQQRVALNVVNSHLNLVLGTGIQAVVDIIHSHVVSPVKLKEDLKMIELNLEALNKEAEKFSKASRKRNKYGESLLLRVCKSAKFSVRDVECVLAMADTNVNEKDNHGWTPLHEAVNAGCIPKVQTLLQFVPPPGKEAVDVGVQNNEGISPLHEAVGNGNLDICKLLVEHGGICLLRKKDSKGVTPLMLAKGRDEIEHFFKQAIRTQEELNLNSNSVLKLSDTMIRLCMLVCEAFISDHHTWEIYQIIKYNKSYVKFEQKSYVSGADKNNLINTKREQTHFRKLRKIIQKLAENPDNSHLVRIWSDRFLYKEPDAEEIETLFGFEVENLFRLDSDIRK
ncbi:uncharacterized protein LOC128986100 [Macrosteles quadrilineatus]|uniref:uncharacterized protein LOC128986100 n=1 Tax=Macrosteles quadrilineatus TaxID=74068 RepID=UPI0023E0913F|nr:uncharacterized protein LOC128986100 [Macrosteles quadrilineatus]XP_054262206.1 uncharacterized protein LOC128986100 [Macrosteles quadrilineatus]XP_054262207.1 uncharacterized protein LOC128986100 [Macrosteles quadrilineatus]XP_054262208.1 uncharacterized protein LOC128986100 [Macrosteles quadrilineatus]